MNRFLLMLSNYNHWGVAAARIAMGLVMAYHGWGKIVGDWGAGAAGWAAFPLPEAFGVLLTLVEFLGGIALILGVVTRFVGVVFTIQFLIIIVWVRLVLHGQYFPDIEKDLALLGISLLLATNGAGAFGLGRVVRSLEA